MRPPPYAGATLLPGGAEWTPRPGCDLLIMRGAIAGPGQGLAVPEGTERVDAVRLTCPALAALTP